MLVARFAMGITDNDTLEVGHQKSKTKRQVPDLLPSGEADELEAVAVGRGELEGLEKMEFLLLFPIVEKEENCKPLVKC